MKDDVPTVEDRRPKSTMYSREHAEAHRRAQMACLLAAPAICQRAVAWILDALRQPLSISLEREKTLAGKMTYGLAACRECLSPFRRKKSWQSFCDQPCRAMWHSKRRPHKPRGASALSNSQIQSQSADDHANKEHSGPAYAACVENNTGNADRGRSTVATNADSRGIENNGTSVLFAGG